VPKWLGSSSPKLALFNTLASSKSKFVGEKQRIPIRKVHRVSKSDSRSDHCLFTKKDMCQTHNCLFHPAQQKYCSATASALIILERASSSSLALAARLFLSLCHRYACSCPNGALYSSSILCGVQLPASCARLSLSPTSSRYELKGAGSPAGSPSNPQEIQLSRQQCFIIT
jgi:hypothetical protein